MHPEQKIQFKRGLRAAIFIIIFLFCLYYIFFCILFPFLFVYHCQFCLHINSKAKYIFFEKREQKSSTINMGFCKKTRSNITLDSKMKINKTENEIGSNSRLIEIKCFTGYMGGEDGICFLKQVQFL